MSVVRKIFFDKIDGNWTRPRRASWLEVRQCSRGNERTAVERSIKCRGHFIANPGRESLPHPGGRRTSKAVVQKLFLIKSTGIGSDKV
jgi:hypothetical protein